jgi:hypothetical protein
MSAAGSLSSFSSVGPDNTYTAAPGTPGFLSYTGSQALENYTVGSVSIDFDPMHSRLISSGVPLPNIAATMSVMLGMVGSFSCWRGARRRFARV